MSDLKVAFVQCPLEWESPVENRKRIEALVKEHNPSCDILVLPETFTTGFSIRPEMTEEWNGETLAWMKELAHQTKAMVMGSFLVKAGAKAYNRLALVHTDGVKHYDKRHTFSLAKEGEHIAQGTQRVIHPFKGWNIRPLICYDLRFPVWCRNQEDTDFMVFVANWPERRVYPWKQLLIARAIENQCYVLGVNRIGEEPSGIAYTGQSCLIDPMGELIVDAQDQAGIFQGELNRDFLEKIRQKLNFQADRDSFTIEG